jgi:hypothetical protein
MLKSRQENRLSRPRLFVLSSSAPCILRVSAGQVCLNTFGAGFQRGTTFGAGLGRREARKILDARRANGEAAIFFCARRSFQTGTGRGCDVSAGQPSSGNMTVMAGCGSSISSGPHCAINFTSLARRLSLRT